MKQQVNQLIYIYEMIFIILKDEALILFIIILRIIKLTYQKENNYSEGKFFMSDLINYGQNKLTMKDLNNYRQQLTFNKKYKKNLIQSYMSIDYATTTKNFRPKFQQTYESEQFIKNLISNTNKRIFDQSLAKNLRQNIPQINKTKQLIENISSGSIRIRSNGTMENKSNTDTCSNPLIQNCLKTLLNKHNNKGSKSQQKEGAKKDRKIDKFHKLSFLEFKQNKQKSLQKQKIFNMSDKNKELYDILIKQISQIQTKKFNKYPSSSLLHKNPEQYQKLASTTPMISFQQQQSARSGALRSKLQVPRNKSQPKKRLSTLKSKIHTQMAQQYQQAKQIFPTKKIFYSTKSKIFKNKQFMNSTSAFMSRKKDTFRTENMNLNDYVDSRTDEANRHNIFSKDQQIEQKLKLFENLILSQIEGKQQRIIESYRQNQNLRNNNNFYHSLKKHNYFMIKDSKLKKSIKLKTVL